MFPRFQLSINWRLSAFCLFFFPLLMSLGFWQLDRASEKEAILLSWNASLAQSARTITRLSELSDAPYQGIQLSARIDPSTVWLLEGRVHQGRPGYEVLRPAQMGSGEWLLVNFGWVPAELDRSKLPVLPKVVVGQQSLSGRLQSPSDSALIDEGQNNFQSWPHRILEVDTALMSAQFGQRLFDQVLVIDEAHPLANVVLTKPVNMPPSKHRAYAIQWFSMACALCILWLFANSNLASLISRNKENNNE